MAFASTLLAVSDEAGNPAELIEKLRQRNAALEAENTLLRQKLDLLIRRVFGVKSEKLDPAQLELLLAESPGGQGKSGASPGTEMPEEAAPTSCKAPLRRSGKRNEPRWPADLPVEEVVIDPQEVQTAPQDWRCIGAEVKEQLDYQPAKFFCRRIIRRKYVHRREVDRAPVIAALPGVLQERCIAAPGLLAQIAAAKYCDHLPLHRQEQIYWRQQQVWLPRSSQARWMELVADWLTPVYQEVKRSIFSSGYVQVDETPVKYLDPGNGKTGQGYLWVANAPRGEVCYHWAVTRGAVELRGVVPPQYAGVLQCDGYTAYPCFAREHTNREGEAPDLILAGCWAHVRRGFFEARNLAPRQAGWMLRQIGHLYQKERELRETGASPVLREAARAGTSSMILRRIHRALILWKTRCRFLPQGSMGKAIDYALKQWQTLEVFIRDGRVDLDNNEVENAIRPVALGRKNWLFVGDAEAGQRTAILYTIIENCRRLEIDPWACLQDVLTRLPNMTNWQIPDVTPSAWARARRKNQRKAA